MMDVKRLSAAAWIGVGATLLIVVQHQRAALGLGWAFVHGAGLSSLLALLPTAAVLAVLWSGYAILTRRRSSRRASIVAAYAVSVLLLSEALTPGTPLKSWREGRAIARVQMLDVRDELIRTARGNPIGIRIAFEAVVPVTGPYAVSASAMTPLAEDAPWPLGFGSVMRHEISPLPSGAPPHPTLDAGVVYTITQDMLPGFFGYDPRTSAPCLVDVVTPHLSDTDFAASLARSTGMRYRTSIQADGESGARRVVLSEYVTARTYDLTAMYETAAIEGYGRCGR